MPSCSIADATTYSALQRLRGVGDLLLPRAAPQFFRRNICQLQPQNKKVALAASFVSFSSSFFIISFQLLLFAAAIV